MFARPEGVILSDDCCGYLALTARDNYHPCPHTWHFVSYLSSHPVRDKPRNASLDSVIDDHVSEDEMSLFVFERVACHTMAPKFPWFVCAFEHGLIPR
jgi:hypothetical protein